MYCPSCGSDYRDEVSECVDCRVPLVREPPMSTKRRHIAIFPPRNSDRPFLLELLGVVLFLRGGFTALNAFIGTVQTFVSDTGPGFGVQILIEGVLGLLALSVAYA